MCIAAFCAFKNIVIVASRKIERATKATKMIIFEEARARDREWKLRMAEVLNLTKEMR